MRDIFPSVICAEGLDFDAKFTFKGRTKSFKIGEDLTLEFNGVDRDEFREVVDKRDIIFITFPRRNLKRPHVGMDNLTGKGGMMRTMGLKGSPAHLALNTDWTLLYLQLVHWGWVNLEVAEKTFEGFESGSEGR